MNFLKSKQAKLKIEIFKQKYQKIYLCEKKNYLLK